MSLHLPSSLPAAALLAGALFVSAAGGAVAGAQITGAQIKNGSVTSKDLSTSTKSSLRGLTAFTTVIEVSADIGDGSAGSVTATCPAKRSALGSVAYWDNQHTPVEIYATTADKVTAFSENASGSSDFLVIRVTCAKTS